MSLSTLLPKSKKTVDQGAHAESLVEKWLKGQGLKTLERNYRCKCGEIDLIMLDGDQVAFVEVRLRSNRNYATGAETVTSSKQRKIINTANHYMQRNAKIMERQLRFDVISVSRKLGQGADAEFEWIKNAFEVRY